MNNEWTRYQSFNGFPEYSPVSPIRLAQAGFYYTGKQEYAVCFCCGLKIGKWNTSETVLQLHRRLSPNCRFITGEDATNVAINSGESVSKKEDDANKEVERTDHYVTTDMETEQSSEQGKQPSGGAQGCDREESKYVLCVSGMRTDYRSTTARNLTSNIEGKSQIELYPGITYEKPKHPDYALKNVRLSSFTDWNPGVMDPGRLAEAGLYYTGVHDCVRCFFCGGGMKDWQNGDNAWIEHARWFPNCAFVKQCKGEDFINMCRMANIDYLTNDVESQNQALSGWNIEGNGKQVEDNLIEDLNSSAAKLVIGMGYGQEAVENGIKFAREKYGFVELRAQYILEFLLDNNYVKNDAATGYSNQTTSSNDLESVSPAATCVLKKTPNTGKETDNIDENEDISKDQQTLQEENRQLKDRMTCKICMDKDACIVFLPCGHMVSCVECARALRKCAVCRTIIQGTVRAYPA